MGIDVHGLNLLKYATSSRPLGKTVTIGRQGVHISAPKLAKLLGTAQQGEPDEWCEPLLKTHFGATSIDSFDYSPYEHATHIADFNLPLQGDYRYDTVFDGGSTEHIFNAPQALENISRLCAPDGRILHVLPANNFCGHGFWQMSPELFFSLYAPAHGYRDTEVFLADLTNEDTWYQVIPPRRDTARQGVRAEIISSGAVYLLVSTRRNGPFSHASVQQADYVQVWETDTQPEPARRSVLQKLHYFAYRQKMRFLPAENSLTRYNPHLRVRRVEDVINQARGA